MADPIFSRGDEVCQIGQPDTIGAVVGEPVQYSGSWFYAVRFPGHRDTYPEEVLERMERVEGWEDLLHKNRWGGYDALVRMTTFTKLKEPLRDVIYSFRATRTKFEPFQFKPLIKFLDSPSQRLLIADEVGLGKTIEAGYILRELKARSPGSFRRVLVVCPSGLRLKWQDEMWNRFEERFDILDSRGVRDMLRQSERLGSGLEFKSICSIQTLRGKKSKKINLLKDGYETDWEHNPKMTPSMLDELEAGCPQLDLVIVDEAHHMRNSGTLSHRLGKVLSDKADAMLFLTATPVHTGSVNLFSLLNLLDKQDFNMMAEFDCRIHANKFILNADRQLRMHSPADYPACREILLELKHSLGEEMQINETLFNEILHKLDNHNPHNRAHIIDIQHDLSQLDVLSHVLTRTRKREVNMHRPQRTARVIRPVWTEIEAEFYDEVSKLCRHLYEVHNGRMGAEFATINLRQQIASCLPAVIDRYGSAEGEDTVDIEEVDSSNDTDDHSSSASVLKSPEFRSLINKYRPLLNHDCKCAKFLETLQILEEEEPGRKVVVFSFFKSTQRYLEHKLSEAGISSVLINGDVPSRPMEPSLDERGNRIKRFHDDPSIRVLLSSEVGAEGLDFQMASHIMINYDLPWNPMRVEQRIGRLDRFGQPSDRIIIFNFSIPGTIEDRILTLLYNRIKIFEDTIGDLEPILGEEIKHLQRELMRPDLTEEELVGVIEDKARVIERKRIDQREVEEAANRFMGHDEYFNGVIDQISQKHQFITAAELKAFVGEYLKQTQNLWQSTDHNEILQLRWTKDLDRLLREYLRRTEWGSVPILDTPVGRSLRVTFIGDIAFENPSVEFLTEHHPLVRAICHQYEQNTDLLHSVSAIEVPHETIPEDDYLYFLYLLTQRGAVNPGKYLEAVYVRPDGVVLSEDHSSDLLHEMTISGRDIVNPYKIDGLTINRLKTIAHEELDRRRRERLEQQRRTNGIYIDNRMASLKTTYNIRLRSQKSRLSQGQAKGAQERYLRMVEGTIRNMENDYDNKLQELESCRQLNISFDCFGAGVVGVRRVIESNPV